MTRLDLILSAGIVLGFCAGYCWGRGCELIDGVRDEKTDDFWQRERLP